MHNVREVDATQANASRVFARDNRHVSEFDAEAPSRDHMPSFVMRCLFKFALDAPGGMSQQLRRILGHFLPTHA